jgi:UDP-N-acetylglucosamine:LPS N-acetylglucosamine transferase
MKRTPRVLAVASSGGHWVELKRILPALEGADVAFASVERTYAAEVPGHRFHWIYDAHRKDKVLTAKAIARLAMIIARERPDVIVTTGSGPGMLAIRLGKLLRVRTVWIESLSSVEEMSMSGKSAKKHADLCLVQWSELAKREGVEYAGQVL